MGKSNGDWCWLVGNEVLQVTSGDVSVHELEKSIGIGLLGKGNGDWCWLISNKVLEVTSGDVGIHKLEETISIGFLGIELNKSLGDWGSGVSDEVLEVLSSDVLTIESSNNGLGGHSAELSSSSLLRDINISVIIWETLIKHLVEGLSTLEGIDGDSDGWSSWLSHDEHGDGNVVVFVDVLGLASGSLSDGIKGIVTDNLSEGLEGHRLDVVEWESWGDNNTDGIVVINWHLDELFLWSEGSGVSSDWGSHENGLGWSIGSWLLVEVQKSLNGVVELLVELGLVLVDSGDINVGVIDWGL